MERANQTIVRGLRRLLLALPEVTWDEILPDVLAGMRFLPHRVGFVPYHVVFKQAPHVLEH